MVLNAKFTLSAHLTTANYRIFNLEINENRPRKNISYALSKEYFQLLIKRAPNIKNPNVLLNPKFTC